MNRQDEQYYKINGLEAPKQDDPWNKASDAYKGGNIPANRGQSLEEIAAIQRGNRGTQEEVQACLDKAQIAVDDRPKGLVANFATIVAALKDKVMPHDGGNHTPPPNAGGRGNGIGR